MYTHRKSNMANPRRNTCDNLRSAQEEHSLARKWISRRRIQNVNIHFNERWNVRVGKPTLQRIRVAAARDILFQVP